MDQYHSLDGGASAPELKPIRLAGAYWASTGTRVAVRGGQSGELDYLTAALICDGVERLLVMLPDKPVRYLSAKEEAT